MKIGDPPPFFPTTLFSRLSAWDSDAAARNDIHIAALAILLEEFDFCVEHDRSSRLDYIIAAYTSISNFLSHSGGSLISGPWIQISKYECFQHANKLNDSCQGYVAAFRPLNSLEF